MAEVSLRQYGNCIHVRTHLINKYVHYQKCFTPPLLASISIFVISNSESQIINQYPSPPITWPLHIKGQAQPEHFFIAISGPVAVHVAVFSWVLLSLDHEDRSVFPFSEFHTFQKFRSVSLFTFTSIVTHVCPGLANLVLLISLTLRIVIQDGCQVCVFTYLVFFQRFWGVYTGLR